MGQVCSFHPIASVGNAEEQGPQTSNLLRACVHLKLIMGRAERQALTIGDFMDQLRKQDSSETVVFVAGNERPIAPINEETPGVKCKSRSDSHRSKVDLSPKGLARQKGTSSVLIPPKLITPLFPRPRRIALKGKSGTIVLVELANVFCVRAQGNYVLLDEATGSHWLRCSIGTMERDLVPFGFVRIHRSSLINVAWVEELQRRSTGEYVLRLCGGQEYAVTRSYRNNLALLAKAWIGSTSFVSHGI
jgi:hypothetical protein